MARLSAGKTSSKTRSGTRSKPANSPPPFLQLDYLYTPSTDVAADVDYFTSVLGAELAFSIDAMGARVAMLRLTEGPPHVLLTDHLEGDRPILIYRVADLAAALIGLKARGWKKTQTLEIPMGPCCSFTSPRGHRIAVYEETRSEVVAHFLGRREF